MSANLLDLFEDTLLSSEGDVSTRQALSGKKVGLGIFFAFVRGLIVCGSKRAMTDTSDACGVGVLCCGGGVLLEVVCDTAGGAVVWCWSWCGGVLVLVYLLLWWCDSGGGVQHRHTQTHTHTRHAHESQVIGIYFSAHWCPPCKKFTPLLIDAYNTLKERGEPFEIM